MQLINGDSCHSQFVQQTAPLPILVADVKPNQPEEQSQRAVTQTRKRCDDLLQLVAEENAEKYETPCIQQRTQAIEEEESWGADARATRQRGSQSAQARNEFGNDDAAHPVACENIMRPANARVWFQ